MVKSTFAGSLPPTHPIYSEGCTVSTVRKLQKFNPDTHASEDEGNPPASSLPEQDDTQPMPHRKLSDAEEAFALDVIGELAEAWKQGGKEAVANRWQELMDSRRQAQGVED